MSTLQVPGATLSYTVVGSGPLLLLVPGGAMDSGPFTGLAAALADRYTVVRYDPRGIGESPFTGEPHAITVPGQSADALALIDALSPDAPVAVLGSSGGAITGLDLIVRHPERVRALVAHEPPCTVLLPDAAEHMSGDDELMRTYREQGTVAAMVAFLATAGIDLGGDDREPTPEQQAFFARMVANFDVFFGQMWEGIAAFVPDVAALRQLPVATAVGAASGGNAAERSARELARQLGREPLVMVGHHVGFADEPAVFADELHAGLRAIGEKESV